MEGHGGTGDGVLNTGLIDKGNNIGILLALTDVSDSRGGWNTLYILHKEGYVLVTLRPGDFLTFILHTTDATADDIIVGTIDHRLGVVHQLQFLHALLLHRTEILLMGRA